MNVCGVCSLPVISQKSYAQHLRGRNDAPHREALARYEAWLAVDLTTYRCSKCKALYRREPVLGKRSGPGLCAKCRDLKDTISSRTYEAIRPGPEEPRCLWDTLTVQRDVWEPHETLKEEVARTLAGDEKIRDAMTRLGITFELFRACAVYLVGQEGYEKWAAERVWHRTSRMGKAHADKYRAMSPDEKAAVLQRRFPRVRSKIEVAMSDALTELGEVGFHINQWQALNVLGKVQPREADLKLTVDDSRKLVILCDGEAFHGPNGIFGNPKDRIRDDVETARAYFDAGYSIARYSETEILSGAAKAHVSETLVRLRSTPNSRLLRTWYPPVETWSE